MSSTPVAAAWPVAVRRLSLSQFRNYAEASVDLDAAPVVLAGPNGIGKTNLLEALSLFAPGRGLRGATLEDMARQDAARAGWSVAIRLDVSDQSLALGTGVAPPVFGRRQVRIDGAPGSIAALPHHLTVLWLTPAMDRLFLDPAAQRRAWLDRLVLALYPDHAGHVARVEHAMRERARLLAEGGADPAWLAALELRMAEHGVAVAAARRDTVQALAPLLEALPEGAFPAAQARLECPLADALATRPALAVEDALKVALRDSRAGDAATGRTRVGPHRADLQLVHVPKAQPAALCSTGEQKALLISLLLAQAQLVSARTGRRPLLLLDEVAAHLDPARREALLAILERMGVQSWMTGTDAGLFAPWAGRAQWLTIDNGRLSALSLPARSML